MEYRLAWVGLALVVLIACSGNKKKDENVSSDDTSQAEEVAAGEDTAADRAVPSDVSPDTAQDIAPKDSWKPPEGPFVEIISPVGEEVVHNPVQFQFKSGGGVVKVAFFADDFPLQSMPFAADPGTYDYDFTGVNVMRHLVLEGYSENGQLLASDEVSFIPSEGYIIEPEGFNAYIIRAVNDWAQFPKDGTYPYCWKDCPDSMGLVHSAFYLGEMLWDGEGSCFCTGHTLEILLHAVRLWQLQYGLGEEEPFGELLWDSVHGGEFYQHWQGYGVATEASSANALESADIGYNIYEDEWETVQPGDFVNLSRTNGTGHAVIFISWIRNDDTITGIRYYGCNSSADSHPDPDDPSNVSGVSGPSFQTEKFTDHGGKVIPAYLFVGHTTDPLTGL